MVLIDLSGTLHIDNSAIPGAVEALNRWFFIEFMTIIHDYSKYYGVPYVLCCIDFTYCRLLD